MYSHVNGDHFVGSDAISILLPGWDAIKSVATIVNAIGLLLLGWTPLVCC